MIAQWYSMSLHLEIDLNKTQDTKNNMGHNKRGERSVVRIHVLSTAPPPPPLTMFRRNMSTFNSLTYVFFQIVYRMVGGGTVEGLQCDRHRYSREEAEAGPHPLEVDHPLPHQNCRMPGGFLPASILF